MSLDGLRAWIGEVERKLGMRTRVFLALATIAIGVGGAGVYLALDARSDSVSEEDVRELQQELEAQIGTGGATGAPDVAALEAELDALRAEVDELRGEGGATDQGKGGAPGGTGEGGAAGDDAGTGDTGESSRGGDSTEAGTSGKGPAAEARALVQQAQRERAAGGISEETKERLQEALGAVQRQRDQAK
jgi:hypothetical protein